MSYEAIEGLAGEAYDAAVTWHLEKRGWTDNGDGTFSPMPPIPDVATAPAMTQGEVDAEMQAVGQTYQEIFDILTPFSWLPDPAGFQAGIGDLLGVQETLGQGSPDGQGTTGGPVATPIYPNPVLDRMGSSASAIEKWSGLAAEQFKTNFVDRFDSVTAAQFLLAGTAQAGLEAEAALWRETRTAAGELAQKAKDSFEAQGGGADGLTLAIVSAVVSVLAAPVGGPAVGTAAAVITGGTGIAGAAAADAEPPPLGGATPEEVLASLRTAAETLKQDITKAEQLIADAMQQASQGVRSHPDQFVSPRPALAGTGPSDVRENFGSPD